MKTKEQLIQKRHEVLNAWKTECDKRDVVLWLPQILIDANIFEFGENGIIRGKSKNGGFLYKPYDGVLKTYTEKDGGGIIKCDLVDNRKNMEDYIKKYPEETISGEETLCYPIFSPHHLTIYMKGFLEGIRKLSIKK